MPNRNYRELSEVDKLRGLPNERLFLLPRPQWSIGASGGADIPNLTYGIGKELTYLLIKHAQRTNNNF